MLPACVQDGPPTLDGGDAGRPAGGVDGAAAHADHVPPAQASPTWASPFRPPPPGQLVLHPQTVDSGWGHAGTSFICSVICSASADGTQLSIQAPF